LQSVRNVLQAYADRRVFRGFSEVEAPAGTAAFRFVWLMDRPMQLDVDVAKRVLRFKRLLPGVAAGSPLYAELKQFLRRRHADDLPEHRRIDPSRAAARLTSRQGVVSIWLDVPGGQYAYAAKAIVNLVHELFVHLREAWPEYLVENFDAAQE
jgi:hypothetical protein